MDDIIVYELEPLKAKFRLLYRIVIFLFSIISFFFILYYWDITVYFGMSREIWIAVILIILSLCIGLVIRGHIDYIFSKIIKLHILRIATGCQNIKVYEWEDLNINQRDSIHTKILSHLKEFHDIYVEKYSKEFVKKVIDYLENVHTSEKYLYKAQIIVKTKENISK
ncbi:MAG: hypothetical protein ABDH21_04435 [bacterium]